MPNLYFTMGLPRSGKSTIANEWAKAAPMRTIVSSDNLRLALTGKRYEPLAETMVFATKHIMIRALLDRGFDVFVDGTHSSRISLERIFEIDINAIPIFVKTDKEECIKRAIGTNHTDLPESIERIWNNFNKIGFWQQEQTSEYIVPIVLNGKQYYPPSSICYRALQKIRKSVVKRNLYNSQSKYREHAWWNKKGDIVYNAGHPVGILLKDF